MKKKFNNQKVVTYGLLFIIISALLTYLILIISHFFDASMKERLHNYLISREGLVVIRLYIVLVMGTITLTFWGNLKLKIVLGVLVLITPLFILVKINIKEVQAAWSPTLAAWNKRQQLKVVNSSAVTLHANTTIAINIDTKALVEQRVLKSDCSDLRVVYQPDDQTNTDLARHLVYPGGGTCATSQTTKIYFSLQADLNAAASSTYYYIYYSNGSASSPSSTDTAFSIGSKTALLVCPFEGSTTCAAGETPSTESGAIRYSGSKSALSFTGQSTNVNAGTSASLDLTSNFTLEAWINPNATQNSGYNSIINKGNFRYWLGVDSDLKLQVYVNNTDQIKSAVSLTPNTWYHVAWVHSVSPDEDKIYVNGSTSTYGASGNLPDPQTDAGVSLVIGSYSTPGANGLNGLIDEVRVSNNVRYIANFTPTTTPFVRDEYTKLLYHFDENGGTTAYDDSGNANTGTITGAKFIDTGYEQSGAYSSHEGVFVEEGTTNKITNPSFENASLYSTNWTSNTSLNSTSVSTSATPTTLGYSFQRKTWYDGAEYWQALNANSQIEFWYSADGTTWTENTGARIAVDTNDFSIEADGTNAFIFYHDNMTLSANKASSYPGTSFSWGTTKNIFAAGTPINVSVSRDSTGRLWIADYESTCFVAGTQITIADGTTVSIENIKKGDLIVGLNPDSDTVAANTVTETMKHQVANYIDLQSTRSRVEVTDTHPFYIGHGQYKEVKNLLVGDTIYYYDSTSHQVIPDTILKKTVIHKTTDVYNLTTDNYHNYIAQNLVVHNKQLTSKQIVTDRSTNPNDINSWDTLMGISDANLDATKHGVIVPLASNHMYTVLNKQGSIRGCLYNADYSPSARWEDSLGNDCTNGTNYDTIATGIASLTQTISVVHDTTNNYLHLVYVDSGGNIKYQKYTTAWQTAVTLDGNSGNEYPVISIDTTHGNILNVSWIRNNVIYYKKGVSDYTSTNWDQNTTSLYSTGTNTYLTSSYQSGNGKVFLGWVNGNSNPYTIKWSLISYNLTASANTTSPYLKFGSESTKIVAPATYPGNFVTTINPGNTNTHTLSAYVYTTGAEVTASDAKLVFNGASVTPTYTDTGGGWWRLSYSASTTASEGGYGIEVQAGKTIYVDGVQLEEKAYATTYADGTLGTGYAWDTPASPNNSTSTRTEGTANFSSTENIGTTEGTVSFWVNPKNQNIFYYYTGMGAMTTYFSTDGSSRLIIGRRADNNSGNQLIIYAGGRQLQYNISSLKADSWHHFVFQWSASSNTASFYENGAELPAAYDGGGTIAALSGLTTVAVGKDTSASWQLSDSAISDFRIYDSSLTSTEVADLYNAGLVSHMDTNQTVLVDHFDPGKGQNPVAVWHFDEGQGTTANDSSPYLNHLTISGPTFSALSTMHYALKFNGTTDKLSRTYDKDFDFGSDAFTISGMFKHPSTVTGTDTILARQSGSVGYKVYMNSSGFLCFSVNSDSACTTTSYVDSRWHYFSAVRGSTTLTLYLDSVQVTQTANLTAVTVNGNNTLYLGADSDGLSNFWDGYLDEVIIYSTTRDANQVKTDNLGGQMETILGGRASDNLTDGLVGYWKMDEAASPSLDSSGNGNSGTWNGGPTSTAGKFGNAVSLDGSDDFVDAGNPASGVFNPGTGSFSIDTWYQHANVDDMGYIAAKVDYASGTGYFIWNYSGYLTYAISGGTGSVVSDTVWNASINNTNWHKVTLIWDAGKKTAYLYLDGHLLRSQTNTSVGSIGNTSSLLFGNYQLWNGASNNYQGSLDDIRIYNRALSPAEVTQLYEYAPGPVAYWNFDDATSSTTVADISGNGNTGTWAGTGSPHFTNGKFGGAGNFNGTDDYVTFGNPWSNNPTQYSICNWVKPNNTTGGEYVTNWRNVASANIWFMLDRSGGDYRFIVSDGSNLGIATATSKAQANTWTHLCGVRNGNNISIYVNGISSGSDTKAFGTITVTGDFVVGAQSQDHVAKWGGQMDDVKIYNYARSQKQIIADMQGNAPLASSKTPVAYFKFDEGYGTTANNSGFGGSALNGSITNGAWTSNGKHGKGLTFEATTSVTTTITDPGDSNAISVWVYPTTSAANKTLVTTGKLATDNNSKPTYGSCTGTALSLSTWTHIVAVSDGSGICKIYQNGLLTASGTTGVTFATEINIGNSSFTGTIDEFKLYNYPLSAEEVKVDYNQGASVQLGSAGSSASQNCPPGEGFCVTPVAGWTFDEGSGTNVNDSSGNGYSGIWSGTGSHWINGKIGKAGQFNGTDDKVTTNQTMSITPTSLTLETWVKPTNPNSDQKLISVNGNSLFLGLLSSRFEGYVDGASGFIRGATTTTAQPNTWYHVAFVADGTTHKIYVNGQLDGSISSTGGNAISGTIVLGSRGDQYNLAGLLDNTKIYNYARTPAQIAWDYNRGLPIAWWPFDENSGLVANDRSGSSMNGTIIGANFVSGKLNNALSFDGSTSYVSATVSKSINAISFWMQQNNTNDKSIIDLGGGYTVTVASNAITAGGFSSPTVYVDGRATTAITDTAWHHVTITTATAFTAGTVTIGKVSAAFFPGLLDDVKLFNYPLNSTQVKTLYNDGAVAFRPPNITYLLNDQFTTARAAGAINGTMAEPTGGVRTVVDTQSKMSITGGQLSLATASPDYNDPRLYYSSIARNAGRLFVANLGITGVDGAITGFGGNTTSYPGNGSFYFGSPGLLGRVNESWTPYLGSFTTTNYSITVVLRTTGAYFYIKGGIYTNWTLLWIDNTDTTSPLYLMDTGSYTAAHTTDNIRIPTQTWLPTPLAYDTFSSSSGSTESTGPDSQSTPVLSWTGGAKTGGKMVITPTLGGELITNGNMESGDPPTGWDPSSGATLDGVADERTGGSGVQSLSATRGTNNTTTYQTFNVTSGAWYQLSAWMKNVTAGYYPYIWNGGWTGDALYNASTSWNNKFTTGRMTGSTFGVYLAVVQDAGNEVRYDDISFKSLTLSSLFSTVPTTKADVIADVTISALTAGTQAGLVLNLDSTTNPQNLIIVYHDGTNLKVEEMVNGTWNATAKQSTAVALGAGALRVIRDGTKLRVYLNNALVGSDLTMTANTNTRHGIFSTYSGNTFDNFSLFPRGTGNEYSTLNNF